MLDPLVFNFFLISTILVDRTPYVARPGAISLAEVPYISRCNVQDYPRRQELIHVWESKFAAMQVTLTQAQVGLLVDTNDHAIHTLGEHPR